MWEKISDYCLDVSKYFLTAVFVTSMMQDLNDVRWMLYVISGLIAIILFIAGIPTIAKIMYVPKKGISKRQLNAIKLKFAIISSFYRYLFYSS